MSTVQGGQGNIVTSGLVLNLDAANPRSYPPAYNGTTWFDLSGNSINGTLTNGPTYSSTNGGNIVLDGVDDFINCGNSSLLNVGNNISVNVWFYVRRLTFEVIVGKVVNGYSLGWEIDNNSGVLRTTFRPSATLIDLSAGTLTNNTWFMGTMTFDGTTASLYLNGVIAGSTSSGGPVTLNSSEPLTIGRRHSGDPKYFLGNIASTQMYNRALTAAEINQNFQATRARFGI